MLIKYLTYSPSKSKDDGFVPINFKGWSKQAKHISNTWSKEVLDFIKKGNFNASKDSLICLTNVMGASDYWGANSNGDAFPESGLVHEGEDHGYKTFEKNG